MLSTHDTGTTNVGLHSSCSTAYVSESSHIRDQDDPPTALDAAHFLTLRCSFLAAAAFHAATSFSILLMLRVARGAFLDGAHVDVARKVGQQQLEDARDVVVAPHADEGEGPQLGGE